MSLLRRLVQKSFYKDINERRAAWPSICRLQQNCIFQPFRLYKTWENTHSAQAIPPSLSSSSTSREQDHAHGASCSALQNSSTIGKSITHSATDSPPFHFDPPFTEVPGERKAFLCREENVEREENCRFLVVYQCAKCDQPIFVSDDAVFFNPPSNHTSGWPTFIAPISPSTLTYRHSTMVQKTSARCDTSISSRGFYVEGDVAGDGKGGKFISRSKARSSLELAIQKNRRHGKHLSFVTPSTALLKSMSSLSQTYLSMNSSLALHKNRSLGITWRERCLRDSNQRADPSPIEGCCHRCGFAVCRLCPRGKRDRIQLDNKNYQRSVTCSTVKQFTGFPTEEDNEEQSTRVFPYKKNKYLQDIGLLYVSTGSALKAASGYLKAEAGSFYVRLLK